MKTIAVAVLLLGAISATSAYCPNGCSGHGTCQSATNLKDSKYQLCMMKHERNKKSQT